MDKYIRLAEFFQEFKLHCDRCGGTGDIRHWINHTGDPAIPHNHPELMVGFRICSKCYIDYLKVLEPTLRERVGLQ